MGLTCKERILTGLLGAAVASGLTTLILFLVEATDILLPADSKVRSGLWAVGGLCPPSPTDLLSLPVWDRV